MWWYFFPTTPFLSHSPDHSGTVHLATDGPYKCLTASVPDDSLLSLQSVINRRDFAGNVVDTHLPSDFFPVLDGSRWLCLAQHTRGNVDVVLVHLSTNVVGVDVGVVLVERKQEIADKYIIVGQPGGKRCKERARRLSPMACGRSHFDDGVKWIGETHIFPHSPLICPSDILRHRRRMPHTNTCS